MSHESDDPTGAQDQEETEYGTRLDEGWAHLEEGRLDEAEQAARAALALDEDAGNDDDGAEALTLLGDVAVDRGEVEEAMKHFQRAIDTDPGIAAPYMHAAMLQLIAFDDPEAAVELAEEALALADEEDEYLDALVLKAEAQLAAGDEDEARETLSELPPTPLPDATLHARAGILYLGLDDLDQAEHHLRAVLTLDANNTDALHGLGLIHEAREDSERAIEIFQKVREADLVAPPPPWGLPRERFEEVAEAAHAALPKPILRLLANVPILVDDYPSAELVAEGNDPRMLGFFAGVPFPEQPNVGGAPHLEAIHLYQRNIERDCQSADEIEDEIRITLLHETGHFFGLDEEDLERMGLG